MPVSSHWLVTTVTLGLLSLAAAATGLLPLWMLAWLAASISGSIAIYNAEEEEADAARRAGV